MDRESTEVMENDMHQTRQSLTDKVAALETHVSERLENATAAVSDTVKTVKDAVAGTMTSVQDSVTTVKAQLDIRDHIRESPWAVMAGAVLSGAVVGLMLKSERKPSGGRAPVAAPASPAYAAAAPSQPGLFDGLIERLRDEITVIGQAALTTLSESLKNSAQGGIRNFIDNTMTCNRATAQPDGIASSVNGAYTTPKNSD